MTGASCREKENYMGGNYFALIADALRHQKQLMDKLETENCELRQQLASLRQGAGISIEISGVRFPLQDHAPLATK